MKQRKIDHINFMVPNMEEALAYYTKVLGYEVLGEYTNGIKKFAFLTDGNETFEFLEDQNLTELKIGHVAYVSENIEEDYAEFKNMNPELIATEVGYVDFLFENGMYFFFIYGVAGERVEFCERKAK